MEEADDDLGKVEDVDDEEEEEVFGSLSPLSDARREDLRVGHQCRRAPPIQYTVHCSLFSVHCAVYTTVCTANCVVFLVHSVKKESLREFDGEPPTLIT